MSEKPGTAPVPGPDAPSPEGEEAGPTGSARRRLPGEARWWRLGLVSATVAALLWGAGSWDGGLRVGPGASADDAAGTAGIDLGVGERVGAASLACPGPELLGVEGGDAVDQAVEVGAATAPAGVGLDAAGGEGDEDGEDGEDGTGGGGDGGSAELRATGEPGGVVDLLGGGPTVLTLDQDAGALVDAEGAPAAGLVGGQLSLSTAPGSRGLSLTACTTPGETQWLVGGGDAPGRAEQLVLTNPGDDAVTVQVDVWGADGPASTTGGNAVVVPARGRSVHLLDALAAQVESPVVRVRASGGSVVAHLGEHQADGTTDLGAEVVGPAVAPTTDLVVPAVAPGELPADGPSSVTLRIAAPGDQAAVVDLTALTEDGAVRLSSRVTRLAAGHTVDLDLDDLPEGVLALRLRSDTPVTAGGLLTLGPSGDEPLPADEAAATARPDDSVATAGPDDAGTTQAPADDASTTQAPADDASTTTAPADGAPGSGAPPPIVRPAGETAWVAATTPSLVPVGTALPARDGIPGARASLAVSVVDATVVTVHWLDERGRADREELGRLANDTTVTVEVPQGARAVWVTSGGAAGVVASLLLGGADRGGPYLAATTLPAVPWTRPSSEVTVLAP